MATNGDIGDDTDDIDAIEIMDHHVKEAFLAQLHEKQKELGKRQREYKKILSLRYKSRKDTIIEKSYKSATERLRLERNDLRAQVWVADGVTYVQENDRFLEEIKCHVNCQQKLISRIKILKKDINNMERGIQQVNREIYELNRKTVPDTQHQTHVAAARKKLSILENRLEVGIRQESVFTALNASMRYKVDNILFDRRYFYDTYSKLMQMLNRDKKYLHDLMESALNVFENCIDAREKSDAVIRKNNKENDLRKLEVQSLMRNIAASQEATEFIQTKGTHRQLAPLQPKEVRRRENFIRTCNHKINLYNDVLTKLLRYSDSHDVSEVKDRFQQQESLYYSYFSYTNELGYHVTLLNNSVSRLYSDLENLKSSQKQGILDQKSTINQLREELENKKKRNSDLMTEKLAKNQNFQKLLNDMNAIVKTCNLDNLSMTELLGDNRQIDLRNLVRYTKLLETRVTNIIACIYSQERSNSSTPVHKFVVRDIEKSKEHPTDIGDIVLTQQCAECAEGEAFNMDDMADESVRVLTIDEVKRKLFDKVIQPEIQYRLHDISHCRLPRSRILAAKRNV